MKTLFFLLTAIFSFAFFSCSNQTTVSEKEPTVVKTKTDSTNVSEPAKARASAAEIMAKKEVPVLCYHHIRNVASTRDLKNEYEVSATEFKLQLKALADSGYKSVTPDQLYNYLVFGGSLPEKPFMITYDDTDEEQFSIAKPEMDKYGFKGVYFIMTISIGRPNYMTKEQIKQLSDEGHVVASHTWDHSRVDRYTYEHAIEEGGKKKVVNDWDQQLVKTKTKLEGIIGKPIDYFAYPFGIWSKAGIPEIEKRGYKMAFQLATKRDSLQPLYTVRRVIVAPQWSAEGLLKVMRSSFK
jgi:peptidoglycan/xylan/chitin deacetylase (PgdA/CDA1 family)